MQTSRLHSFVRALRHWLGGSRVKVNSGSGFLQVVGTARC